MDTSTSHLEQRTANRIHPQEEANWDLDILAHELRSPLQIIIAYSQMLLSEREENASALSQTQFERIQLIATAGDQMRRLISRADDLTAIEQGRMPLPHNMLDIKAIAQRARSLVLPFRQRQEIIITIPDILPPLYGDEDHLKQIWLNLLTNALKSTPVDGTITLGVEVGPDSTLDLYVRDTGRGIAKKYHKLIFELGWQAPSEDAGYQGHGMGLALVKRLVTLYHGTVWVESTYHHGATFWVRLPAG
jgi:signal transduction histidine kinase